MTQYSDIQSGAFGLLYETTSLLNKIGTKYIIVGGWTPYLLNSEPIQHPGTKDVDVLFDRGYEKGQLKEVILAFLNNGFILSAKHDFQLFKQIQVKENLFIYNVDLLHPLETIKPKDIYVEHIDLDIPADKYLSSTFKMKSIALPSSQSLFDYNLITPYNLEISVDDSTVLSQTVPLMGEIGTLVTKSKSVLKDKRYRDSLDIYLTIKQSRNYDELCASILKLKSESIDTYNSLYGIREAFENLTLLSNTLRYVVVDREDFNKTINSFLEAVELNKKATH